MAAQAERSPVQVSSRIGLALLAMLAVWRLVGLPLEAAFQSGLLSIPLNTWTSLLFHTLPLYVLGLPAYLLVLRTLPDGPDTRPKNPVFGPRRFVLTVVGGLGLSLVLALLSTGLLSLLGRLLPLSTQGPIEALTGNMTIASGVVASCIAGFGEEFIFRVCLYKKMRGCPDISFILVSALSFSLMHGDMTKLPSVLVVGVLYSYIYLRSRNYLLVAALHAVNDVLAFIGPMLLQNSLGGLLVMAGLIVLCGLVGVVLFFRYRRRVKASLLPAAEPGWSDAPQGGPPGQKQPGAVRVCLANPGMMAFMVASLFYIFLRLAGVLA